MSNMADLVNKDKQSKLDKFINTTQHLSLVLNVINQLVVLTYLLEKQANLKDLETSPSHDDNHIPLAEHILAKSIENETVFKLSEVVCATLNNQAFINTIIPMIAEKIMDQVKPKIIVIVDDRIQPYIDTIIQDKDALILQEAELKKQSDEIKSLKSMLVKVEYRTEEQEQYSRRTSLRFHNVPVPTDDNGAILTPIDTDDLVLRICNKKLQVKLNIFDIGRSHPIGEMKDGKISIIVRFLSYRQHTIPIDRGISDHDGTYVTINCGFTSSRTYKRKIWDYKNGDFDHMNQNVLRTNWEHLISDADNINVACTNFTNSLLGIASECIPTREVVVRCDDKICDRPVHDVPRLKDPNQNYNLAYESSEKSEILNKYFCSIANLENPDKDLPVFNDRCADFLSSIVVSEQDVYDIISTLHVDKAVGPDIISNRMLLAVRNQISKPLCVLRLINGSHSKEGRLEIFHSEIWGSVCVDGLGQQDAPVACRQLGFWTKKYKTTIVQLYTAGHRNGTIWLDDIACNGNENKLEYCHHKGWSVHNCGHGEDVGLRCYGNYSSVKGTN
ncbi:unnamed protein product [Mytilus coruscus]|uniref:SRCR domain-containing protein n=1 Tax=Mytilus coruscus TaxID=42192 RepID=A0A6J8ER22_MYTCO|nr:unnamed protein product [Mytilus coruscus]